MTTTPSGPSPMTLEAILDIVAREGMVERAGLSQDRLLVDLGIASLEMINVLFAIEDRFGVIVEASDLEGVATLGDMYRLAAAKLSPDHA